MGNRIPSGSTRSFFIMFSVLLFALTIMLLYVKPPEQCLFERRNLYQLAVAALLIFDAALIAEVLGVAVAIVELVFGVIASIMGVVPEGFLMDLGMIGGVLLMFIVGSEIELGFLSTHLRKGLVVGLSSFLGPAIVSLIAFVLLGFSFKAGFLIAISLSTTSVAVVYALLSEKNLLNRGLGQNILASAMIADIASIIALTLIVARVTYLIVLYAVLFLLAPFVLRRLLHSLPYRSSELGLRLIISTLLVLTVFSEAVGFHAVLIAFILGLSTSDIIRRRGFLDEKIRGLVFGFFAPLFFFTAGLHVGGTSISGILGLLAVAFFASYIPKIAATYYAARRVLGVTDPAYSIMFGARLTVSTIAALLGLSAGMITSVHYSAIILSAVISTVVSGIIVGKRELLGEEEI